MNDDLRVPVVVGAGAVTCHAEDPEEVPDPVGLMAQALDEAAEDAGAPALLEQADMIWTPRGFWRDPDPGRLLAERFGASRARTGIAEIGVLQTTLLGRAAQALAEGESEVVLIVGGETRDRDARLARLGKKAPMTPRPAGRPDRVLEPRAEIMGRHEIELGLIAPVTQYAMIENALRFAENRSIEAHRAELGRLWGDLNRVAVDNPRAWNRTPIRPEEIAKESVSNRMLSFPYTKSLVSQWNVNQAGALVLCTLGKARSLGLDETRFVYPLAVVDSESMLTLSERREVHRSPGFRLAAERAFSHVGGTAAEVDHLELYSCFPAAVRVQQRELRIAADRRVTQTGGMAFAGGPLNNFVLQGWAEMVGTLRRRPGSRGLVTAVSGLMTKQGVSVLGTEPGDVFLFDGVTEATRAAQATIAVEPGAEGSARVASYTVIHERDETPKVALLFDFDEHRRTLRVVGDRDLAEEAERVEFCGREAVLGPEERIRWR
ncbi:MAG TPA: acetyl-CoA acetyltransferase [Deltaproteobacteria bacterium]|nr:acetyl-CoA acetyltransferase [Deltaproteobacteria bacterium]